MTAEEWIDDNSDKAGTRFTNDGITLWEESEVCEMMQEYALHIAGQAVEEEKTKWINGWYPPVLDIILSRIKTLSK